MDMGKSVQGRDGGKESNLQDLCSAGFPVPLCFFSSCVTHIHQSAGVLGGG